ncbi:IucA/IucC family protein [Methylobacterium nodulans]|uniref:IucA/IucC family protein n=1 Tax=Methylobacterium nodulans (strain LMG 21967 / CNCM I-2342 / ORS 2060) TaxID=460265 RepID=B8IHN3_METNO|nr:IucA/IucC family protein [Methylobacterium nodulans]ACL61696.1 IucA/IucC family protein [Methylobacterium nodulans ORS 2060]
MTRSDAALAKPDPTAAVCQAFATERLLNTWLRECASGSDPAEGERCAIPLGPDTLLAHCLRRSPSGFHQWGWPVLLRKADGHTRTLDDPAELAHRMIDALAPEETPAREAMRRRILDGLLRSRDHARACAGRAPDRSPAGLEQSLWHGHPFHPLAKSIDGFSDADFEAYAPERGAAYRLCWLLADPDLVGDLWRDPDAKTRTLAALADLSRLSSDAIGSRIPIPSHPWQAARLEADPTISALIAAGRLTITGPSGGVVTPTSSVRTVFAPEQNLFLKLPIAARITNFARTNSREHLARSIAAARALAAIPESVAACGLDILSERGALHVNLPGLEAVTGVLAREGPARRAFVVAGLLEPAPGDGQPILAGMGCALTGMEDAKAWLHDYARVVILPPLRLFAATGISLEAHAQNSLLSLDAGRPARLVVRDLEGVSIDAERFARLAPDLLLDPAVHYTRADAWQRLLYYLIVNQVAHVVATVARAAQTDEAMLWSCLAEALTNAREDAETAVLIRRLLEARTLPAKANFVSCLTGRSERPDYVAIDNPLRSTASATRSRCGGTKPETAPSDHHAAWDLAGRRVSGQLLGALLHEELLPGSVLSLRGPDEDVIVTVTPTSGAATYRARARRMRAYGRVLLDHDSLESEAGPVTEASAFVADLLPDLPGTPDDHARFAEEVARTQANHAMTLAQIAETRLSALSYDDLEGRLPDGHRYHPCFKSRIGFTPADNRAFGPEFGEPLRPVWIAAHRSLAVANAIERPGHQDEKLLGGSLDPATRAAFSARITASGGKLDDFFLMPVHPWQWERVADGATAAEQQKGLLIPLGASPHVYTAQQSIRTLADRTAPDAPSLKLSLSIRNTSTARTLAPHTVLNAPIISAWLHEVAASDAYLRASGTILLAERMGVAVTGPLVWDRTGATRGALSAIWRDPVAPYLEDEEAVPFAALTHLDGETPFVAGWIARYGIEAWVDRLLTVTMLPVVHVLVARGIALESHQQNMVLLHRDGWPTRVALKDFHDGVRFIPELLGCRRPALLPTPPDHARVNANSYVEAQDVEDVRDFMVDALFGVNLAELGWCLDLWFGYSESRFWHQVITILSKHCAAYPAAREGALRYRLGSEMLVVEALARRRLDPKTAHGRPIANPLAPLAAFLA